MSKARSPTPPRVTQALARLGAVERGDPGVSLGIYATVLFGYGMIERLECLGDVRWDRIGLAQSEGRLPRRIRHATE